MGGCLELSLAGKATWQAIVNVPTCRMDAREVAETAGVEGWKLRTLKGPGGGEGVALIAQGQGQSEVSLPSGLGHPSRYPDSRGHRSASLEMNSSFLTPPVLEEGPAPGD